MSARACRFPISMLQHEFLAKPFPQEMHVRRARRFRATEWVHMRVRILLFFRKGDEGTHRTGVGHDVGDVLRRVHCVGAVRAVLRNFGVVWHDEREAMAVDDVPVERVELVSLVRSAAVKEGKTE